MLAWGMIAFPGGYSKAGQTAHGLDTLRWGTDYMLASYLGTSGNSTSYVAQVWPSESGQDCRQLLECGASFFTGKAVLFIRH